MTMLTRAPSSARTRPGAPPRRLLVTRRDPATAAYQSLGFLTVDDDGTYEFRYLRSAVEGGQRPLPGLPLDRRHISTRLFPVFDSRVISPRRADREMLLDALHLPPTAAPFEVLARSGGRRATDAVEVIEVPEPDDEGRVRLLVFAHGIRHLTDDEVACVDRLRHGDVLSIDPEPTNPVDPGALLFAQDGTRQGYVPRPLLPAVREMAARRAVVEQVNGPEVGHHLRLLVSLTGTLQPGHSPFTGQAWALH